MGHKMAKSADLNQFGLHQLGLSSYASQLLSSGCVNCCKIGFLAIHADLTIV
jgi:hypothetical protein